MGLFGLARDIGRKLFNKDEEAAAKLAEHLKASGLGISDLAVK